MLGLIELTMPDHRFLPLVNYRRYRLKITHEIDNRLPRHHRLVNVWENFKAELGETMTFDGKDPAFVIHFLYTITDLLDQRGYNEALAFNFLPRLLRGEAKDAFETARTASATSARPVNNWPSAVKILFENYAHYRVLKAAEADLKKVKQSSREDESQYLARFEKAHLRTGSILDTAGRIVAYVDGLDEAIRENILLYLVEHPSAGIIEVSQRALHEGNLWRHRSGIFAKSSAKVVAAIEQGSSDEDGEIWAMEPGIGYRQPGWQKRVSRKPTTRPKRLADVCPHCYRRGANYQLPPGCGADSCVSTLDKDSGEIIQNFLKLRLWEQAKVNLNQVLRATGALDDSSYNQ